MLNRNSNFSYYESFKIFLASKTNLFLILSIFLTSAIIYPFLIPHLRHANMAYHIIIHIVSLDVALFLTTVSFISYRKTKSKKLLLTWISFVLILIVEVIYLLQASNFTKVFYIPLIDVEFSHLLLLGMLVLFAGGVLKVDKK